MAKAVVVGYATKWGSTRKVAEAVAPVLRERGLAGEVRPAREIRDLGPHGGVALGGALYRGRWHRDARRFLKRQRRALATMPVAVFAMGPRRDEVERFQRSRQQLERALAKAPQFEALLDRDLRRRRPEQAGRLA